MYVLRVSVVIDFESVVKCGVDMVTSGGELLIATRGARRPTTEDEKGAERHSRSYSRPRRPPVQNSVVDFLRRRGSEV